MERNVAIALSLLIIGLVAIFAQSALAIGSTDSVKVSYGDDGLAVTTISGVGTGTSTSTSSEGRVTKLNTETTTGNKQLEYTTGSKQLEYVSIEITPEKQVSGDGTASYKIIIKDLHPQRIIVTCIPEELCIQPPEAVYRYILVFYSPQDIEGQLEIREVVLGAGQSRSLELKVKTEQKGTNVFSVAAKGEDSSSYTKGILIYGDYTEPPSTEPYFSGDGFIVDSSWLNGRALSLKLLEQDGKLRGKLLLRGQTFDVSGTVSDNGHIELSVMSLDDKISTRFGSFSGELKMFGDLRILHGTLSLSAGDDSRESWELTALDKNAGSIKEIVSTETTQAPATEQTKVNDVVVIKESSSTSTAVAATTSSDDKVAQKAIAETQSELYVRPVKVTQGKILGIFPNPWGKKVVELEIVDNGTIVKKEVKAFESTRFKNYAIGVGSLDDEQNIELSVKNA
ncbi:MAG: hypothetical protein Q7S74_00475 [Nanoarchaeota archaeon]|nr:hypothetical protein [Nanoarchaeota archaeon]